MTEQAPRRIFSGLSEIMDQLLSGETVGESLRVAKILDGVNGVLEIDDSSSSSSIRRLDTGTVQITIGAVPFRTESIEEFGWGVEGAKEQMLVKLSHETAHAFQSQTGYEQALVDFLNGSNNIDEKFHPYIELYTFLNSKGVCNGLADSEIYHIQSTNTGLLSVTTLEDITEFIGAYLISDDYFNFRLDESKVLLSGEDQRKIAELVVRITGK